jgi:hypothetical protein
VVRGSGSQVNWTKVSTLARNCLELGLTRLSQKQGAKGESKDCYAQVSRNGSFACNSPKNKLICDTERRMSLIVSLGVDQKEGGTSENTSGGCVSKSGTPFKYLDASWTIICIHSISQEKHLGCPSSHDGSRHE